MKRYEIHSKPIWLWWIPSSFWWFD